MIRKANIDDLARIMDIERAGFSEAEAATEAAMKERIEKISDTFFCSRGAGGCACLCRWQCHDKALHNR